jgi:glyoxylase-like metal-dependent hydrolase (beta-lactamase superfamily II)
MVATNCYVLENEQNECILVDIADNAAKKLIAFIRESQLKPLVVLVTHGHFDHCLGVKDFLSEYPIDVYGHEADKFRKLEHALGKLQGQTPMKFVEDGDVLHIGGFRVRVLHTPGHTAGSVCYSIENNMFSGDTLFRSDIGRTDLPSGDRNQMNQSLKKLYNLDGDYAVYPGHEESTTLQFERDHNRYMKF